ncbi:hypothetical protein U879_03470 [Defluviimonas sp. 20V17]|nr:transcription termination/antitermination NusG family protein [Allgaiera indica]KDB05067.1 hypothetical protein U879_03470 [Defluviimonas sp. 20V17]
MSKNNLGEARWLAQLEPNCYQLAECNQTRKIFQIFLPRHHETRRGNGKFSTGLRPLFPGYLFAAFDPTRGLWRAINGT